MWYAGSTRNGSLTLGSVFDDSQVGKTPGDGARVRDRFVGEKSVGRLEGGDRSDNLCDAGPVGKGVEKDKSRHGRCQSRPDRRSDALGVFNRGCSAPRHGDAAQPLESIW